MIIFCAVLIQMAVGEPVYIIHPDIDDESVELIVEKLLQPKETEAVYQWADLQRTTGIQIVGDVDVQSCTGLATNSMDVMKTVQKLEHSINYVQAEQSANHLLKLDEDLGCLSERISPSMLANILYLEGLMHFYNDNLDQAVVSWRQALLYFSELQWNEDIEPSAKGAFENTKESLQFESGTSLSLLPSNSSAIFINGERDSKLELPQGRHLLQFQKDTIHSKWFTVSGLGQVQIIDLSVFPDSLEEILADEALSIELLYALKGSYPNSEVAIVQPGNIWRFQPNDNSWELQAYKLKHLDRNKRIRRNRWVLASTLSAVSAGLYYMSYSSYLEFDDSSTAFEDVGSLRNQTNLFLLSSVLVGGSATIPAIINWRNK